MIENCNNCAHQKVCKNSEMMVDKMRKFLEDIYELYGELRDVDYHFIITASCKEYLSEQEVYDKIVKRNQRS